MEGVAPPLQLLLSVKRAIEKGHSVKQGIHTYLKKSEGEFPEVVTRWLALLQQGQDPKICIQGLSSIHRRTLLQVLERGLKGESIHNMLLRLEEEIIEACHEELTNKIARLPFILMVPLLLFQFPAFLMLLFGPLLQNFFHSLGGG
ncbi:type II secretion system F family protein [Bdellovibrio bacteriovorus]